MPTKTRRKSICPPDIETVIYPDEFIEELQAEVQVALSQIRSGELPYIPLEEFALKHGVDLSK
jgi:hypothetical protein